jgi:hypothetical protein
MASRSTWDPGSRSGGNGQSGRSPQWDHLVALVHILEMNLHFVNFVFVIFAVWDWMAGI